MAPRNGGATQRPALEGQPGKGPKSPLQPCCFLVLHSLLSMYRIKYIIYNHIHICSKEPIFGSNSSAFANCFRLKLLDK